MWPQRLFWTVFIATAAVYGVMIFWTIPEVTRNAGGLAIFDMRPTGYSFEDARAFLQALSPDGAAFYATVQHRLDTVYPLMLAVTLGWALYRLAPVRWGRLRMVLAAFAIPGMVFDYLENAGVAAMLEAGADGVTEEMVAAASFHSQAKAMTTTLAMSLLAILAVRWATRRWRRTGNPV